MQHIHTLQAPINNTLQSCSAGCLNMLSRPQYRSGLIFLSLELSTNVLFLCIVEYDFWTTIYTIVVAIQTLGPRTRQIRMHINFKVNERMDLSNAAKSGPFVWILVNEVEVFARNVCEARSSGLTGPWRCACIVYTMPTR